MNITAFMNLMVILVPFLLITATFSQIAVLDVTLPGDQRSPAQPPDRSELRLAVVVHADGIEVLDGERRLERLPRRGDAYDLAGLDRRLDALKRRFPSTDEARLLAEPATPYEDIVAIMDHLRADDDGRERFPVIGLEEAGR